MSDDLISNGPAEFWDRWQKGAVQHHARRRPKDSPELVLFGQALDHLKEAQRLAMEAAAAEHDWHRGALAAGFSQLRALMVQFRRDILYLPPLPQETEDD